MTRIALKGLYVITDARLIGGERLIPAVESAIRGGARWVQYRDKQRDHSRRLSEATALADCCRRHHVGFIVNDDIELALASRADGVHLGEEDPSLPRARRILGSQAIIGISCYDRLDAATEAEQQGADYVAFGSVFPSPTKPEAVHADLALICQARATLSIPVCAIGGINAGNAAQVAAAGADMLAVISGVFSEDDIESVARRIASAFDASKRSG